MSSQLLGSTAEDRCDPDDSALVLALGCEQHFLTIRKPRHIPKLGLQIRWEGNVVDLPGIDDVQMETFGVRIKKVSAVRGNLTTENAILRRVVRQLALSQQPARSEVLTP